MKMEYIKDKFKVYTGTNTKNGNICIRDLHSPFGLQVYSRVGKDIEEGGCERKRRWRRRNRRTRREGEGGEQYITLKPGLFRKSLLCTG
jgi:hypothetical protein